MLQIKTKYCKLGRMQYTKRTKYFFNNEKDFFLTKNNIWTLQLLQILRWLMWALATLYRQASYLLSDNESYSQCNQGRFPLLTESAFTQLSDHKLCSGFFFVFASFLLLCSVRFLSWTRKLWSRSSMCWAYKFTISLAWIARNSCIVIRFFLWYYWSGNDLWSDGLIYAPKNGPFDTAGNIIFHGANQRLQAHFRLWP